MANILVHSLVLFTDYCITDEEKSRLSARGLKELKQTKIQNLRQALTKGENLNQVIKYHLLLPTEQAHHNFHPTPWTCIICSTNTSEINRENVRTSYWRSNRYSRRETGFKASCLTCLVPRNKARTD